MLCHESPPQIRQNPSVDNQSPGKTSVDSQSLGKTPVLIASHQVKPVLIAEVIGYVTPTWNYEEKKTLSWGTQKDGTHSFKQVWSSEVTDNQTF